MVLRFIHVTTCIGNSFLFIAEEQKLVNFFCKGPRVKPTGSMHHSLYCCYLALTAVQEQPYTVQMDMICSNRTLKTASGLEALYFLSTMKEGKAFSISL